MNILLTILTFFYFATLNTKWISHIFAQKYKMMTKSKYTFELFWYFFFLLCSAFKFTQFLKVKTNWMGSASENQFSSNSIIHTFRGTQISAYRRATRQTFQCWFQRFPRVIPIKGLQSFDAGSHKQTVLCDSIHSFLYPHKRKDFSETLHGLAFPSIALWRT